jgi:hypothetical protein
MILAVFSIAGTKSRAMFGPTDIWQASIDLSKL